MGRWWIRDQGYPETPRTNNGIFSLLGLINKRRYEDAIFYKSSFPVNLKPKLTKKYRGTKKTKYMYNMFDNTRAYTKTSKPLKLCCALRCEKFVLIS